jgi:hypothetical protein
MRLRRFSQCSVSCDHECCARSREAQRSAALVAAPPLVPVSVSSPIAPSPYPPQLSDSVGVPPPAASVAASAAAAAAAHTATAAAAPAAAAAADAVVAAAPTAAVPVARAAASAANPAAAVTTAAAAAVPSAANAVAAYTAAAAAAAATAGPPIVFSVSGSSETKTLIPLPSSFPPPPEPAAPLQWQSATARILITHDLIHSWHSLTFSLPFATRSGLRSLPPLRTALVASHPISLPIWSSLASRPFPLNNLLRLYVCVWDGMVSVRMVAPLLCAVLTRIRSKPQSLVALLGVLRLLGVVHPPPLPMMTLCLLVTMALTDRCGVMSLPIRCAHTYD